MAVLAASAPTVQSRSSVRATLWRLNSLTGIAVFVAVWEILPRLGAMNPSQVPPFSDVVARLGRLLTEGQFWSLLGSTMSTWAIGLAYAVVLGFVLGFLIGVTPGARDLTHTTIEFLRPIPSVALIPVVTLIFGLKAEAGIALITWAAMWPILLQTQYGLDDIDVVARDTARSYRFGPRMTLGELIIPTLLPYLFTGLRLSAAIALVLGVTAEMVLGVKGLGNEIMLAQGALDTPKLYALVLVIGVIGVLINIATRGAERRTLHWHASVRNLEAM
ncbi:ABC transporter permease [Microbacterium sp. 18062]|uniref:ABC transporter permease n=1 Tax=Microbacterium sp. 18062 TaxID=2681410 RepID=UPI00190F7D4C|nr:ABC transporter permease [Microbacterium sp. 18062]